MTSEIANIGSGWIGVGIAIFSICATVVVAILKMSPSRKVNGSSIGISFKEASDTFVQKASCNIVREVSKESFAEIRDGQHFLQQHLENKIDSMAANIYARLDELKKAG